MKKNLIFTALVMALSLPALGQAKNLLSVHILNQQTGKPASGVEVTLEQKQSDGWKKLNAATTDQEGRIPALWPAQPAAAGDYRIVFQTGKYFSAQHMESFFPEIPVEFHITNTGEHYHVPLLLSQYGYSTYRGS